MQSFVRAAAVFGALAVSMASAAVEVTAWVPPYAIESCQSNLEATYGSVSTGDALTSLSLQLWAPTSNGGAELANGVNASDVEWFVSWCASNSVKALLTIYNADGGSWDWPLAVSAFSDNQDAFVANLVAELDAYGLDGIDIDLEGTDAQNPNNDREAFSSFIAKLSTALKAKGKMLTVCSFADRYNGPSTEWWGDWTGNVDFIRTMLYNEGADYSSQLSMGDNAGIPVTMGLPGWVNSWSGTTPLAAVQNCLSLGAGVAIWDLGLGASDWKSGDVWSAMADIKALNGTQATMFALSATAGSGGSISKNPSATSYEEGTYVLITAIPDDGFVFSGWSGDLSGTANPATIQMNAAKSVTANFTAQGGGSSFNLLAEGEWISQTSASDCVADLTRSGITANVSWTIPKKIDAEDYPSVDIDGSAQGNFSGLTSVVITYTSNDSLQVILSQTGLSDTGGCYVSVLPKSTSARTVTLSLSDFAQPYWVSPTADLDLVEVSSLQFAPAGESTVDASISGNFSVSQCILNGVTLTPKPTAIADLPATKAAGLTIRSVGAGLAIAGLPEAATVSVFDLSGRLLNRMTAHETGSLHMDLSTGASRTAIVQVKSAAGTSQMKVNLSR